MILLIIILCSPLCCTGELYGQYCGKDCEGPDGRTHKHTVCERAMVRCKVGGECGSSAEASMMDELRKAILDKHNELRNKVALGEETRGPQPAASNMNILNYNFELEFIAQCLANTCIFDHDPCRNGLTLSVGQNLATKSSAPTDRVRDIDTCVSSVQSWYDEVGEFDTNEIDRYTSRQQGTGHYTQMVWADIEYIGCGRTLWYNDGWYNMLLVCNYGGTKTGGNLISAPMYKKGEACSSCPADKPCNEKYKGLCGKIIPLSEVDRGIYGRSSTLKFVTIFGTNIKLHDVSVCLVITIWCFFTKMLS